MKTSQMYDEGFYNEEYDFIEVILKIGPSTYYQGTKDQLSSIRSIKDTIQGQKEHISQLEKLLNQK